MPAPRTPPTALPIDAPAPPGWASRILLRVGPAATRWALARILGYVVLSRAAVYLVAATATRILPGGFEPRVESYLGKSLSLAALVRWDAWWYLSVVERGYWFDPQGKSNVAFFPVFPVLIKGLSALLGNPVVAGLLLANLAAMAATLALWSWVRRVADAEAAERAVLWLLVYPFSFFLNSIYAEPLFFLLATLALMAAGRRSWLAAGLWGAVAAATRPMGVLLGPALAWGLWREWRTGRRPTPGQAVGAVLPALGLGAYMAFLWASVGDPLAFWTAHARGWHVQLQWTLATYWRETFWILSRMARMQGYTHLLDVSRLFLPLVFGALCVSAYRRFGPVAGVYAGLATLVAVLFAPDSVGRELLAVTPAFAAAGLPILPGRTGEALRMFSLALLFIFLFAFVTGHFVG